MKIIIQKKKKHRLQENIPWAPQTHEQSRFGPPKSQEMFTMKNL